MIKNKLNIWFIAFILTLSALSDIWGIQKTEPPKRVYTDRMAGYDKTVVLTDETIPNSCVMTYFQHGIRYTDINYLIKIMPSFEIDGKLVMPSQVQNLSVDDFPGGVIAKFKIKNILIETKIRPLLVGREKDSWEGSALYEIKTEPNIPVIIHIGSGKILSLLPGRNLLPLNNADVRNDSVNSLNHLALIDSHTIQFKSGEENIPVIVKSSDIIKIESAKSSSRKNASIRMESGSGQVLIAYSNDQNQLLEISKIGFETAKNQVDKYYANLLKSSNVETPDANMNNAFRSAIYNLEYNWIKPYGWMECLHHWYALFQQQVSAGAEWIGQEKRSKSCIIEQAQNLIDDGNVPQFMPDGKIKRDFGGSNQYWVWQIRHYINFTGDTLFAKEIIPYLDSVIAKTIHQHDKDGDMLFSWGLQIGNQEDFIGNPGDATNPSIEMVNMFRTRAELSDLIGDKKEASLYSERADEVVKQLHDKLWLPDLGRFAYFKDLTGNVRLDGQYETYLYPIIWNIVDPLDQYTGLQHLLERLTRKDGAIFCSNNFSWHAIGTWGMQCGEAQQPWAAWGFSKFGLNNMTWRPLKAMADWAMDINHRGAWPEISDETIPAYFTPPAGLYIASMVEALFGLKMNAPKNTIEISPSFPDSWPNAKLTLPEVKANYQRDGNRLTYTLETTRSLEKIVRWKLPPAKIIKCLVNSRKVNYTIEPGVDHIILHIDSLYSKKTEIVIQYEPIKYSITYPRSIAEGDTLELNVKGMIIKQIDDRCKVLRSWDYNSNPESIIASINKGLLKPYEKYGRLGQLNFSQRTFFIHGSLSKKFNLWFPVNLTILPRFEATSLKEIEKTNNGYSVPIQIRNNTSCDYNEPTVLRIHGKDIHFIADIKARSEVEINLLIPADIINTLSPGDNNANLYLQNNRMIPITLTAKKIVKFIAAKSMINLSFPESDFLPDTLWNELRVMPGFPHIFFMFSNYGWPKPMIALEDSTKITVPEIPGLSFQIPHRKFIPVSHKSGKVSYRLNLKPGIYKKLYLLVLPFVDNHDMFTKVARITAYSNNEIVYKRTLCYPGDIDYWVPNINPYTFATFREPRLNRFGLLPLLKPDQSDWTEGQPPAFPEPGFWSTSIPVVTKSCLMDVIEIDLNRPMKLDNLVFESIGDYNAFGIVGAVGEIDGNSK